MHARINPEAEYLLRPHGRISAPELLTHALGIGADKSEQYVQSLFTRYRIYPLPPKERPT